MDNNFLKKDNGKQVYTCFNFIQNIKNWGMYILKLVSGQKRVRGGGCGRYTLSVGTFYIPGIRMRFGFAIFEGNHNILKYMLKV